MAKDPVAKLVGNCVVITRGVGAIGVCASGKTGCELKWLRANCWSTANEGEGFDGGAFAGGDTSARASGASEGDGVESRPKNPNGIEFCCLPFAGPIEQSSPNSGNNCGATDELLAEPL